VRTRVVAPLVAAIIGIACGGVTALVMDTEPDRPDVPTTIEDPLALDIPMIRVDCAANHGLLVLGYGDTSASLRAAMGEHPDEDLRYVDVAQSCDTVFAPERLDPPAYALVLGPFPDLTEPCRIRMTEEFSTGFVTHLRAGNQISVKCVCVLPKTAGPELRLGMDEDVDDVVWVRGLQNMFVDADAEHPETDDVFLKDWVTGTYDVHTEARVRRYQERSSVVSEPGVVDAATWQIIKSRACKIYDF
jgi:hypothetical protein